SRHAAPCPPRDLRSFPTRRSSDLAWVNRRRRYSCVAMVEPLPGRDRPSASVRQFMELAVNMPEQEPQVGHAADSTSSRPWASTLDRKSTRLNSSHVSISYAVFCLK